MTQSLRDILDDNYLHPRRPFYKSAGFWARLLLVVQLLSVIQNMVVFFQTDYQLTSPLIPQNVVLLISRPYLICALWLTVAALLNLVLLFVEKYRLIVILGALSILGEACYLGAVRSGLLN